MLLPKYIISEFYDFKIDRNIIKEAEEKAEDDYDKSPAKQAVRFKNIKNRFLN